MLNSPPGPTLLGFDVLWIGSILAGCAAVAVLFAIYTAVTIRDPMQKRVKALNERREQLKAGIVTQSAKKRASLVHKNETTDWMKGILSSLKVLQQSQLEAIQQKLVQAGIRRKEMSIAVIFARMVLPIVLGGTAAILIYGINYFPDWGPLKRLGGFAAMLGLGYKGPEIYIQNMVTKRSDAIRKGQRSGVYFGICTRSSSLISPVSSTICVRRSSPNCTVTASSGSACATSPTRRAATPMSPRRSSRPMLA